MPLAEASSVDTLRRLFDLRSGVEMVSTHLAHREQRMTSTMGPVCLGRGESIVKEPREDEDEDDEEDEVELSQLSSFLKGGASKPACVWMCGR